MRSTLYFGSTSLGFRFLIPRDSYPFTLFLTSSSKFSLLRHRFPQRCLTPQCGPSLRNKVKRLMHRELALHSRASFQLDLVSLWRCTTLLLCDSRLLPCLLGTFRLQELVALLLSTVFKGCGSCHSQKVP